MWVAITLPITDNSHRCIHCIVARGCAANRTDILQNFMVHALRAAELRSVCSNLCKIVCLNAKNVDWKKGWYDHHEKKFGNV
jgi:hypothetical protein